MKATKAIFALILGFGMIMLIGSPLQYAPKAIQADLDDEFVEFRESIFDFNFDRLAGLITVDLNQDQEFVTDVATLTIDINTNKVVYRTSNLNCSGDWEEAIGTASSTAEYLQGIFSVTSCRRPNGDNVSRDFNTGSFYVFVGENEECNNNSNESSQQITNLNEEIAEKDQEILGKNRTISRQAQESIEKDKKIIKLKKKVKKLKKKLKNK